MSEKRVLLLEDNDAAATIFEYIKEYGGGGFRVSRATGFRAAERYAKKPGLDAFSLLVMDLNIPSAQEHFTPEEWEQIARLDPSNTTTLSGWVWLKRHLSQNLNLANRVVVLSAYVQYLPESEKEPYKDKIVFIEKTDRDALDLLGSALRKAR